MSIGRVCLFGLILGLGVPAWAVTAVPFAPGSARGNATAPAACPTFHWAAPEDAATWELVVYRLESSGEPTADARRIELPGSARGWTPNLANCLVLGGRYAWTLRALMESGGSGEWSEPLLFEVASAPSRDEVGAALAVLERFMATEGESDGDDHADSPATRLPPYRLQRPRDGALPAPASDPAHLPKRRQVDQEGSAGPSPVLGVAALSVDRQLHLGPASHSYKDGRLYQWSDPTGNNSLGRGALKSNTTGAFNNAVGRYALRDNSEGYSNTAMGDLALSSNTTGYKNTAVGDDSLGSNTTGDENTAVGEDALLFNTTGSSNTGLGRAALGANVSGFNNTAVGMQALRNNVTGYGNTAVGQGALFAINSGGYNTALGKRTLLALVHGFYNVAVGDDAGIYATGNSNILINSGGVAGESNTLRFGAATGTSGKDLDRVFIQGIHGRTVSGGIGVLIKPDGQLGTSTSSRRFKEEIEDMGKRSADLLDLRPVTFRFTEEAVGEGQPRPLEFGLIAEEVEKVFPELVVYDEAGEPYSLRYHHLTPMLLNEVQRLQRELEELRRQVAARE